MFDDHGSSSKLSNGWFVFCLSIVCIVIFSLLIVSYIYVKPKYPSPEKKYFLAAGAIFKNESHILKEWIEHHRKEGFEHIWLVNDHSTDNYEFVLQPYIDEGYVTLFDFTQNVSGSKQNHILTTILYPIASKETNWFIANDLDEFITTRDQNTVAYNLRKYLNDASFIQLDNVIYGSSGNKRIPSSAIQSYTKRINLDTYQERYHSHKTLCRPELVATICIHRPRSLLHTTVSSNPDKPTKYNMNEHDVDQYKIVMNHYQCQSEDFWTRIKMTRGDAHYKDNPRHLETFIELNKHANQINDTTLANKRYHRPNIHMVVSRYNESLDWLKNDEVFSILRKKSASYQITIYIYNCGPNDNFEEDHSISLSELYSKVNVRIQTIQIKNYGMGIYKYLTHVLNHYDNLADMNILIPATGWHNCKRNMVLNLLKGDWNSPTIFTNVRNILGNDLYQFRMKYYVNLGSKLNPKDNTNDSFELKPAPIYPFGEWYYDLTGDRLKSITYSVNYADIIGLSRDAIRSIITYLLKC